MLVTTPWQLEGLGKELKSLGSGYQPQGCHQLLSLNVTQLTLWVPVSLRGKQGTAQVRHSAYERGPSSPVPACSWTTLTLDNALIKHLEVGGLSPRPRDSRGGG